MNNIFFNLVLPLIIIAIFLGVLTYLCFFKQKKKQKKKEQNCYYNAHITDLGISEKEVFTFLEKNNIEPQFLKHKGNKTMEDIIFNEDYCGGVEMYANPQENEEVIREAINNCHEV